MAAWWFDNQLLPFKECCSEDTLNSGGTWKFMVLLLGTQIKFKFNYHRDGIKHLLSKLSIYKGAGTQVFGYHSYSDDKETDLFEQTDFLTTDLYN